MRRLDKISSKLLFLLLLQPAHAQEFALPVPRTVIYPGDTLSESMLEDRPLAVENARPNYVRSRTELVGKIARRTLLPGQPIPVSAVDQPRLVTIGAQVKIVYLEAGMTIVAFGVAQQAGSAGDLVRVRNAESGLFVIGRVQDDGSIRVGET